jgi:hypothetical protein
MSFDMVKEEVTKGDDFAKLRESLEPYLCFYLEGKKYFEARGATFELTFFVEMRQGEEIKTPKYPREHKVPDANRFGHLNGAVSKKKLNMSKVEGWFQECCRGKEGRDLCGLGVAVIWLAVQHVFAGVNFEFFPCPDGDACLFSYVADVVLASSHDRDHSSLWTVLMRANQAYVQLRNLKLEGGSLRVQFCDARECVHAIVKKLLPKTWALIGEGAKYLADVWRHLPEDQREFAFVTSLAIWLRTELTDVEFWGENLEGTPRNARYDLMLEVLDSVVSQKLLAGPVPDGLVHLFVLEAAKRRGIMQSFLKHEEEICVSVMQSWVGALLISGRADGLEEWFMKRIARLTGISCDDKRVANRVDPTVRQRRAPLELPLVCVSC